MLFTHCQSSYELGAMLIYLSCQIFYLCTETLILWLTLLSYYAHRKWLKWFWKQRLINSARSKINQVKSVWCGIFPFFLPTFSSFPLGLFCCAVNFSHKIYLNTYIFQTKFFCNCKTFDIAVTRVLTRGINCIKVDYLTEWKFYLYILVLYYSVVCWAQYLIGIRAPTWDVWVWDHSYCCNM